MKTAGKLVWTMGLAGIVLSSFMVSCSEDDRNVRDRDTFDESAPGYDRDVDVDRDRDFDMDRDRDVYDRDVDVDVKEDNTSVEIRDYRQRTEAILDENEEKIEDYREKVRNSDDAEYKAKYEGRIDALEEENDELRARLKGYNREKDGNWESFKREFEHDMNELGNAIKGLFQDEKN